jgi:hypothetical protein
MTVIRQHKTVVLQEHILTRLSRKHDFDGVDITEWTREVALCGVELGTKKGGPSIQGCTPELHMTSSSRRSRKR